MSKREGEGPTASGHEGLDAIARRVFERFEKKEHIKSFGEFLDSVREAPWLHSRSSAQYIKDCFDAFGTEEVWSVAGPTRRFKLFDLDFAEDEGPVFGQEAAQNQLYAHLSSFADRGLTDKILVLRGPNGTGKTSLIKALMRALEHYSHQPEGILYTFNWVFSDNIERAGLGFGSKRDLDPSASLAHLDAEDITFKIPSDLRDNPLLLLPPEERRRLIEASCRAQGREPRWNRHILYGDISHKSRVIYNELLASYHGDWARVMQHVQVVRFFVSRRYRRCAVTIEPQRNVDAGSRSLNLESGFQLPSVLHQADIQELRGDLIDGNRGVIEYSDFFKRPMEVNKYLLTTSEQGTISVASTMAYLDALLIATSNEKHLGIFKNDPDFSSFKARMELVRVPYLLQWRTESRFYGAKLPAMARGKDIGPRASDVLGLWAVLTRLRRPQPQNYKGELAELVKRLSAVEKAELYDSGRAPEGWRDADRQELIAGRRQIAEEFEDFEDKFEGLYGPEYEGRRGISAREMLTLINEASLNKDHRALTGLAILETIRVFCRDRAHYDFLRLDPQKTYGDIEVLTQHVVDEYRGWVSADFRDATELVSEEEYERLFQDYIAHVRAWKTGEKVHNPRTREPEEVNAELLREVEGVLGVKERPEEFRDGLIMRIAGWALENPGTRPRYREIFGDLFKTLKRSTYERRKRAIRGLQRDLLKLGTEEWGNLRPSEQEAVTRTLTRLKERHGYTEDSARELVAWLISQEDEA